METYATELDVGPEQLRGVTKRQIELLTFMRDNDEYMVRDPWAVWVGHLRTNAYMANMMELNMFIRHSAEHQDYGEVETYVITEYGKKILAEWEKQNDKP